MSSEELLTSLENQLASVKRQLEATKRELHELKRSKSLRIGSFLVRIARAPLRLVGRKTNIQPVVKIDKWAPFIEGTVSFERSNLTFLHFVLEIEFQDVTDVTVYRESDHQVGFTIKYPPSYDVRNWNAVSLRWDGGFSVPSDSNIQEPPPTAIELAVTTVDIRRVGNRLPNSLKGGDIAIVSTFRPPGRSAHNLVSYLGSLSKNGFQTIIVDTSDSVPPSMEEFLRSQSDLYIPRDNIGWDFSSWLSTVTLFPELESNANRILLTNDSNFGPFSALEKYLTPNEISETNDLWGLTESLQHERHLQSFFVLFERSSLEQSALTDFAKSYKFPTHKERIILDGEVALTQLMLAKGLRLGVHHSYDSLTKEFLSSFGERLEKSISEETYFDQSGITLSPIVGWNNYIADQISQNAALNPTHHFWDLLIEAGYPFIKRELIQKNPAKFPNLRQRLHQLLDDAYLDQIYVDTNL